jgi:hypothetical protein
MLGLILCLAPFFPSAEPFQNQNLYFYLYAVWGLLILLIGLISLCLPKSTGRAEREKDH